MDLQHHRVAAARIEADRLDQPPFDLGAVGDADGPEGAVTPGHVGEAVGHRDHGLGAGLDVPQQGLAAAQQAGDVYPLLLSSFGCGPASFIEHFFTDLLGGYPHTILESDGHGGAAQPG